MLFLWFNKPTYKWEASSGRHWICRRRTVTIWMNVREKKFIDWKYLKMHCTRSENEKPITKWLCCLHALCWLLTRWTASVRWNGGCDVRVRLYYLSLDAIDTHTHTQLAAVRHHFFAYTRWVKGIYLDFYGLLNAQSRLKIINCLLASLVRSTQMENVCTKRTSWKRWSVRTLEIVLFWAARQ